MQDARRSGRGNATEAHGGYMHWAGNIDVQEMSARRPAGCLRTVMRSREFQPATDIPLNTMTDMVPLHIIKTKLGGFNCEIFIFNFADFAHTVD
eukprot:scaffold73485_cov48-Prasinocladus_malaysianus.AAC.1